MPWTLGLGARSKSSVGPPGSTTVECHGDPYEGTDRRGGPVAVPGDDEVTGRDARRGDALSPADRCWGAEPAHGAVPQHRLGALVEGAEDGAAVVLPSAGFRCPAAAGVRPEDLPPRCVIDAAVRGRDRSRAARWPGSAAAASSAAVRRPGRSGVPRRRPRNTAGFVAPSAATIPAEYRGCRIGPGRSRARGGGPGGARFWATYLGFAVWLAIMESFAARRIPTPGRRTGPPAAAAARDLVAPGVGRPGRDREGASAACASSRTTNGRRALPAAGETISPL
jgi:hypothetical protein